MPKTITYPPKLVPYITHGLDLQIQEGSNHAYAECPFCGKEGGKFRINVATGLGDCKRCLEGSNKGGFNITTFLRRLHELELEGTSQPTKGHIALAKARKLLSPGTLLAWGVVQSSLSGEWVVPGYNHGLELCQLYRYETPPGGNKPTLLATPTLSHGLFGGNLWKDSKPDVYLCEGPWDAMALWEVLRLAKRRDDDYLGLTGSSESSLQAEANVLAVPGCTTFNEHWLPLFAGRRVFILYDNDHPKEVNGKTIEGAGITGVKRVARMLLGSTEPPKEVQYLAWGPEGYNRDLPSGHDVRDALTAGEAPSARIGWLEELFDGLKPIPDTWGVSKPGLKNGEVIELLPCTTWNTLVQEGWRKALKWGDGLDRALSVMLACITSTKAVGDQLWAKIIGPPACGKSTLCEALSTAKRFVTAKSTIRGFHSGFKSDSDGSEDNSLLATLKDKTLVTKDGDTLLQSPNLGQILSEARDIYDRVSRTHYRNKMSKDYDGINLTWLLCGTSSLRCLDSSELGERFLDCVIIDQVDEDEEDEVGWRIANRADRELSLEADGKMETRDSPEMVKAKLLTGGYVEYLRTNAQVLLDAVTSDEQSLRRCQTLAKFVAYMRARPSKKQEEKAERELSYRLISQLVRLAKCLAVVLNRPTLDTEVMRRVELVALDTARGRTLNLVKVLYEAGGDGADTETLALKTGEGNDGERKLLLYLRKIGVTMTFKKKLKDGTQTRQRWKLTERMRLLYGKVIDNEAKSEP